MQASQQPTFYISFKPLKEDIFKYMKAFYRYMRTELANFKLEKLNQERFFFY